MFSIDDSVMDYFSLVFFWHLFDPSSLPSLSLSLLPPSLPNPLFSLSPLPASLSPSIPPLFPLNPPSLPPQSPLPFPLNTPSLPPQSPLPSPLISPSLPPQSPLLSPLNPPSLPQYYRSARRKALEKVHPEYYQTRRRTSSGSLTPNTSSPVSAISRQSAGHCHYYRKNLSSLPFAHPTAS